MSLSTNVRSLVAALFITGSASSCGPPNTYVWVQDLPEQARATSDDLLSRRFRGPPRHQGLQRRALFDEDARAGGRAHHVLDDRRRRRPRTHAERGRELACAGLKRLLNAPIITVAVEEARPISISVVGEAASPGLYNIQARSGVLQAIAQAGASPSSRTTTRSTWCARRRRSGSASTTTGYQQ